MFKQSPGDGRNVGPAAVPPELHNSPNPIDVVGLSLLLVGDQVVEQPLLFLLRRGDGDKVATLPPALGDLVRNGVAVVEAEMAGRFLERRVQDRVFDDDVGQGGLPGRVRGEDRQRPYVVTARRLPVSKNPTSV